MIGDESSFMKLALEEAEKAAALGEVPVGAVLVHEGEIFCGHNSMIAGNDPTAHAEIVVIRKACEKKGNYRLPGSVLFVTLEPCIMCAGAIVQARISRLVYGTRDFRYGAVESLMSVFECGLNHRPEISSGLMADEASRMLKDFFRAKR